MPILPCNSPALVLLKQKAAGAGSITARFNYVIWCARKDYSRCALVLRTSGPGRTNLFDVGGSNIVQRIKYTKGPHSVEAFSVYGAPGRIDSGHPWPSPYGWRIAPSKMLPAFFIEP